ncbi:HlyD family secretion protein [Bradyrhizobium erythrophlei]|jgi:membrane fusion protein (multidrug efflux system)|uniref:Membrane fusion protein, multidrug efflux system n=1 Tax=Bradyrhizobium erythrophlei TaxID=1437360 RepID=A0A1M5SMH3_9BRAD|nr:HlyD family secretion protein [Bradyrhizobium erythrophlei]SHH39685.1 membrane fusion protein, multidrug efflux system [Bradyrhizobium erythrophlei]
MAEDLAELEMRAAEPERNERPDPAPTRKNDDQSQREDGRSKDREVQDVDKFPKPLPRWPLVLAGLVVVIFAAAVLYIIFRPRPDVRTADAYVTVHYATIAPRISGQVATVPVDDNDVVKTGQVLATLDPRDNQTAVAAAEAAVARDRSRQDEISASVSRQPAIIAEQQAAVVSARARLAFAQADARRYDNLAATGAGTTQEHQRADSTLSQGHASLDSAEASLDAARRQLDVLKAQRSAAEAAVRADEAQLEQARLNLSYTRIRAPVDGMVGERSVQVGNYVGPGTTLMTVVPLDQVYIEANYREVALLHVRSGQPVTIHLDAYDVDLKGTVDSVPPASGAAFAPIAPNNATGNFTKIVQRLPVKIVVTPGQPLAKLLRVGLSVETTIHTGLEDVVDEQRRSSDRVTGR